MSRINKMHLHGYLVSLILFSLPGLAGAQTISVTPPVNSDGFFHPGDAVTITVDAQNGCVVTIASNLSSQISPLISVASPYTFTLSLPTTVQIGVGYIRSDVNCPPVGSARKISSTTIDVEPTTIVTGTNLSFSPKAVWFQFAGQKKTVDVLLNQNGVALLANTSSQLKASSSDSTIVSVSGATLTAGNHAGTATVTFSLGTAQGQLQVTNEGTGVQGDLNGDGKVDIDDVNIIEAALNTPANGSTDARDLNHDGVINALDARILTTLCTYPRCATHQ